MATTLIETIAGTVHELATPDMNTGGIKLFQRVWFAWPAFEALPQFEFPLQSTSNPEDMPTVIVFSMIFPFALIVALVGTAANAARRGRWQDASGTPLLILLSLVACLVAGYVAVTADPYFDDNGAPEFIELEFRGVWALLFGDILSVVVVPTV